VLFVVELTVGVLGVFPYTQSDISTVAVPCAFVILAVVVTVVVVNS